MGNYGADHVFFVLLADVFADLIVPNEIVLAVVNLVYNSSIFTQCLTSSLR